MLIEMAIAFAAGLVAGAVYFAGLWLTVRRLADARRAPLWLLISAIGRMAFLIAALFWIMDGQWQRLLAALVGVISVRLAATWSVGAIDSSEHKKAKRPQTIGAADADHAR